MTPKYIQFNKILNVNRYSYHVQHDKEDLDLLINNPKLQMLES